MYIVRNTDGDIIAIASRREDAAAMAQTVGNEPTLTVSTK